MSFQKKPVNKAWKKVQNIFWPAMGISRLVLYYRHRVGRMAGTPRFIAAGVAAGVAVSFTPFMGLHILTGALLCWIFRGSFIAMTLATFVTGNPWTFPFIWLGTYELGHLMLGKLGRTDMLVMADHLTLSALWERPVEFLLPMTLGSLPLAFVGAVISFYISRSMVAKYKKLRLDRILGKHKRLLP